MNLMCDFETTTEPFFKKYGYTRVWANCIVDIDRCQLMHIGNSIDDFINFISSINDCRCYFHNLKFDGEFIVSYLLNNGFKNEKNCPKPSTFDTIIDKSGVWYKLTVNLNGNRVHIYDSLKKLPFSVSQIAKLLNLEEQKGCIDYDLERCEGYNLTDSEKEYIINDCIIVAKALKSLFDRGLKSMTLSGDAQKWYISSFKSRRIYEYHFPAVSLKVDSDIRLSYKGGFVYCNPQFAGQIVEGVSFDVNSLYPSILHDEMLPFGVPEYFKGKYKKDDKKPLYIQHIEVDFEIKAGFLPTIQIKHSCFNESEYLASSNGVVTLWLTSPDLELFLKHYDCLFIKYIEGYKFRQSNMLFKNYVDFWYNEKNQGKINGNATQTLHAKLMLNSLYGRYGMQTARLNKIPHLNEFGNVEYGLSDIEFVEPQYTAVASFVTAYARKKTIEASQLFFEQGVYLYSDTDSVHVLSSADTSCIEIDNFKLGAWKNEGSFIGKFLRAKTYIKNKNGKIEITCAGMPDRIKEQIKDCKLPFEEFEKGHSFLGKLVPKRVKGGVILVNTEFTIKI